MSRKLYKAVKKANWCVPAQHTTNNNYYHYSPALRPWEGCLTSLGFGFIICKRQKVVVKIKGNNCSKAPGVKRQLSRTPSLPSVSLLKPASVVSLVAMRAPKGGDRAHKSIYLLCFEKAPAPNPQTHPNLPQGPTPPPRKVSFAHCLPGGFNVTI